MRVWFRGWAVNKDATKLTAEYLRLFVAGTHNASCAPDKERQDAVLIRSLCCWWEWLAEAIARAAQVAAADGSSTVEIEHLERILPQLLLDF